MINKVYRTASLVERQPSAKAVGESPTAAGHLPLQLNDRGRRHVFGSGSVAGGSTSPPGASGRQGAIPRGELLPHIRVDGVGLCAERPRAARRRAIGRSDVLLHRFPERLGHRASPPDGGPYRFGYFSKMLLSRDLLLLGQGVVLLDHQLNGGVPGGLAFGQHF